MGILGRRIQQTVVTVGAMLLVASVWSGLTVANAQDAASDLDIAEAGAFVGDWTLAMNSDQGPIDMSLAVKDVGGKVAAEISSDFQAPVAITKISKSEDKLVLTYGADFQGQVFDVIVTLSPAEGDTLDVAMDFAGGQFLLDGTGTK